MVLLACDGYRASILRPLFEVPMSISGNKLTKERRAADLLDRRDFAAFSRHPLHGPSWTLLLGARLILPRDAAALYFCRLLASAGVGLCPSCCLLRFVRRPHGCRNRGLWIVCRKAMAVPMLSQRIGSESGCSPGGKIGTEALGYVVASCWGRYSLSVVVRGRRQIKGLRRGR